PHSISDRDWSSDVCSSDLQGSNAAGKGPRLSRFDAFSGLKTRPHENDPAMPQIGQDAAKIGRADGNAPLCRAGDVRARLKAKQRSEERRVGNESDYRCW